MSLKQHVEGNPSSCHPQLSTLIMTNNSAHVDEKEVYLALKNVFKGHNAEVRQIKVVRRLVGYHSGQESVARLVRAHDLDQVCNAARALLNDDIFSSIQKAKAKFPQLFSLSPTQSAKKEASQAEAAGHEAESSKHAGKVRCDESEPESPGQSTRIGMDGTEAQSLQTDANESQDEQIINLHSSVPPLFPIYLPMEAQHEVLVRLQKLLELACFEYGKDVMPETLKRKRWSCAVAVELNQWTEEFTKSQHIFSSGGTAPKQLTQLLRSITNIRHSAVHRHVVTAKGVQTFLFDAEAFVELLGQDDYRDKISNLRRHVVAMTEELQRDQKCIRLKLSNTLRSIDMQREELRKREVAAIANMEEEDGNCQELLVRHLDEIMAAPEVENFTTPKTSPPTCAADVVFVNGSDEGSNVPEDLVWI